MTTQERITALAPVLASYPELGRADADTLREWVLAEMGRVDALDGWASRAASGGQARAVAPRCVQHILAGNLAVSGIQSIVCGLLVGAQNVVKLATGEDDEAASERVRDFVQTLPEALRETVIFRDGTSVDSSADVVIVYGGEETILSVRASVASHQRVITYGPKVSVLWLGRVEVGANDLALRVAHDVAMHGQAGCLSPQAIYIQAGSDVDAFLRALSEGLAQEARALAFSLLPGQAAAVNEARDMAVALGDGLHVPCDGGLAWTVIHRRCPGWEFSPGHRTVFVREVHSLPALAEELAPLRGKISTIGLAEALDQETESALGALGVSRFCPTGRMQHPPIGWHHDARPQLADLVTWRDDETA